MPLPQETQIGLIEFTAPDDLLLRPMQRAEVATPITRLRVLLVDDDDTDLYLTQRALEKQNYEVVSARSVNEAVRQITSQSFDVLLTDLHMPNAGDGFSVVTAMRHCQPDVLILLASDFPDVQEAMKAIALQADLVLVKPFDVTQLASLIDKKKLPGAVAPRPVKEAVASILDREVDIVLKRWLERVEQVKELAVLPLAPEDRTMHFPEIVKRIPERLRIVRTIEAIDHPSPAAIALGQARYRQGYTAPLLVQESRLLQVTIFETVERNLATVDFTTVLPDIMIVADEVDCQLKQTIDSFLSLQDGEALAAREAAQQHASSAG